MPPAPVGKVFLTIKFKPIQQRNIDTIIDKVFKKDRFIFPSRNKRYDHVIVHIGIMYAERPINWNNISERYEPKYNRILLGLLSVTRLNEGSLELYVLSDTKTSPAIINKLADRTLLWANIFLKYLICQNYRI